MIACRRHNRDAYRELVADVPGIEIFGGADDEGDNCWLTAIVVDPEVTGWQSDELREHLAAEDIESRPLWKPMHLQPVYRGAPAVLNGNAQSLFESGLTLPSGSALSASQLDRVLGALSEFIESRK
jgi:dTDP-4-amino-4,6-dideoxygalactose transaminase